METVSTQMVFKGTRWYEISRRVFGKRKEQNLGTFIKDGEREWKDSSVVKRMAALAEEQSLAPGYIVAYNHL